MIFLRKSKKLLQKQKRTVDDFSCTGSKRCYNDSIECECTTTKCHKPGVIQMGNDKAVYSVSFVRKADNRRMVPVVVIGGPGGSAVGEISSYNIFDSTESARSFIKAQKVIAKQIGLTNQYETILKNYELVSERTFVTRGKI